MKFLDPSHTNRQAVTNLSTCVTHVGFPGGLVVKNPPVNAGDTGSIPGSGRSPGEGNGGPLQDSCLGNPMGRVTLQAVVHGVKKESDTTYWLKNNVKYNPRPNQDLAVTPEDSLVPTFQSIPTLHKILLFWFLSPRFHFASSWSSHKWNLTACIFLVSSFFYLTKCSWNSTMLLWTSFLLSSLFLYIIP